MPSRCRCINCITPPHLLKKLLESSDNRYPRGGAQHPAVHRAAARRAACAAFLGGAAAGDGRRIDLRLPERHLLSTARLARTEDGPASADPSVNRAFDGFGADPRLLCTGVSAATRSTTRACASMATSTAG